MEAITNTTNEQKCNKNIVDAMPALYAFALQQQVPVSDTFCWDSQHCSPGAVCLHTRIKLYATTITYPCSQRYPIEKLPYRQPIDRPPF